MVYIRILQQDQPLPTDPAIVGNKYPGRTKSMGVYGMPRKPVPDYGGGDDSTAAGQQHSESNKEVQGTPIRSTQSDLQYVCLCPPLISSA